MSKLSPADKRNLRGMAQEQDQSKAHQRFLLSQAQEDVKTAKEKRAAADRRKKRADDRMDKLNKFEPILSLKRLKKMTVDGDKVTRIKGQLSWHRHVGGDVNIPKGFHGFRKVVAWVAMVRAVERHAHGVADQKLKGMYMLSCRIIHILKRFTEPDELDNISDPFADIEIASDADGSNDGDDGNNAASPTVVSHDDDDPSILRTIENLILENDVLLDSATNSGDESVDFEDEETDSEVEDADFLDEGMNVGGEGDNRASQQEDEEGGRGTLNHWFDGVEFGVVPPAPTCSTGDRQLQKYRAGCRWVSADWSCSYDAVFMSFWAIYEQSSASWRGNWIQHRSEWNTPLSNNFDHLILLADTPVNSHDYAMWFSRYRDRFRDQLSRMDPKAFPRTGPLGASASGILQVVFGRDAGPYLEQRLVCSDCGTLGRAECEFYLIAAGHGLDHRIPTLLRAVWENFIQRCQRDPFHPNQKCSLCRSPNEVRGLEMPDVPWIWFEREQPSPVVPSLTLTFNSPAQRLSYSLQAIIYVGQYHFTVRFRERSGRWWNHDGQIASGVPQLDDVQSEEQLLVNGTRFANMFIYRRDGQ